MKIRTKSVHTGVQIDKTFNSVITPIYPSSTFYFDRIGKNKGYDYTRTGNPTRAALEKNIAALEGGVDCSVTATGMAAVTAVMFYLKPGDHVVTGHDIYGGTYRLFDYVLRDFGIDFSFVDMRDLNNVKKAIRPNTKMIWIETPSNPLLNIVDIKGVVAIAKKKKILTVCDNTFMTPCLQKPLALGVDVVVHSTTKYLNGHSDVVGGAIVYGNKKLQEKGRYLVNALGVAGSPFDAWLVLRGVKTLAPRMEVHQANAIAIAKFLEKHPGQAIIRKQMSGFGAMVTFELNTKKVSLGRFFKKLKYFALAESLGGVESLVESPWYMSHSSMGEKALKASGITKETVRVSVGIEDAEDLIADLAQALKG